jgi:cell division protein FtsB
MATRTRLTPFARLFLFLIIILPLAYGGASYMKGEDPIANIKEMIGGEQSSSSAKTSGSTYNAQDEIDELRKENKELRQKIKDLQKQLDDQKSGSEGTRQKWGN